VEKDTPPEETYGKYFIPGDFHWSDGGNRKVAKILAPQVLGKMTSASVEKAAK
jgi:hypothetical protein